MGGKNAVIVMDDADLQFAVEGIIWSAFGTAGNVVRHVAVLSFMKRSKRT